MSTRCLATKPSTPQRNTGIATRTSPVVSPTRRRRSGIWDGAFRSTSRKGSAAPSSGRGLTRGTSENQRSNDEEPALKFVLATYGTRGDVEPGAAVGLELLRRGHDVRMAVPPDLIGFAQSAGAPPPALRAGPTRLRLCPA